MGKINKWVESRDKALSAWSSILTIIGFPLVVIGLFLGYFQLKDALIQPSVELNFASPSAPTYSIQNTSGKIAENVLVSFGIFDVDSNPQDPLRIPAQEIDYVNKFSSKGPWSLLGKHGTNGHRYFGIMYLGCKGCSDLQTYWIYIRYGDAMNSFYTKRNTKDTFQISISRLISETDKYLTELVPKYRRNYFTN